MGCSLIELLGEPTGRVKDAVQPGRRITALRTRDLEISVRTAPMSPARRAADQSRQNSLPSGSVITMKPALIGGAGS